MKAFIATSLLLCASASGQFYSSEPSFYRPANRGARQNEAYPSPAPAPAAPAAARSYPEPQYDEPASYAFEWQVQDDYTKNNFGHKENREDTLTSGEYYVLLPDGRTQKVSYTVDGYNGYQAEVSYEGEAQYPAEQQSSYPRPEYRTAASEPEPSYQQAAAPAKSSPAPATSYPQRSPAPAPSTSYPQRSPAPATSYPQRSPAPASPAYPQRSPAPAPAPAAPAYPQRSPAPAPAPAAPAYPQRSSAPAPAPAPAARTYQPRYPQPQPQPSIRRYSYKPAPEVEEEKPIEQTTISAAAYEVDQSAAESNDAPVIATEPAESVAPVGEDQPTQETYQTYYKYY